MHTIQSLLGFTTFPTPLSLEGTSKLRTDTSPASYGLGAAITFATVDARMATVIGRLKHVMVMLYDDKLGRTLLILRDSTGLMNGRTSVGNRRL